MVDATGLVSGFWDRMDMGERASRLPGLVMLVVVAAACERDCVRLEMRPQSLGQGKGCESVCGDTVSHLGRRKAQQYTIRIC